VDESKTKTANESAIKQNKIIRQAKKNKATINWVDKSTIKTKRKL